MEVTIVRGVAQPVPVRVVRRLGARIARVADPVPVGVLLPWIRDAGAIVDVAAEAVAVGVVFRIGGASIARVADPVPVEVGLSRVRKLVAVVAGVADPVGIGVLLSGVGDGRTVVDVPAISVAVGVVPRVGRTGVAPVPEAVRVGICLIRVDDGDAVVADVAERIAVGVLLIRVRHLGAVVDVPAIPVGVDVVPRVEIAGLAGVPPAVAVAVELVGVRGGGTVVAGAPERVPVAVLLVAVGDGRAVVDVIAHAVAVAVVGGDGRAWIAGVPRAVEVVVFLPGVRIERTVVERRAATVPVVVVVGAAVARIARVSETVSVGVALFRVRNLVAVVAGVAAAVRVEVRLVGVGDRGAVVRRAARPVEVGVGAGFERADVARVADPVGVPILLAGVGDERAGIARVAPAVGISVELEGVGREGAEVLEVGNSVAVGVPSDRVDASRHDRSLFRIGSAERTFAAAVHPADEVVKQSARRGNLRVLGRPHGESVRETTVVVLEELSVVADAPVDVEEIRLVGARPGQNARRGDREGRDLRRNPRDSCDVGSAVGGVGGAVSVAVAVARIPHAVSVEVLLRGIRGRGTVVACVAEPVGIAIEEVGVRDGRAVVARILDAVPVVVGIADVPIPVSVEVGLRGVRVGRAVVLRAAEAVSVVVDARNRRARIAKVPDPVPVLIGLERIGDRRAEIVLVGHSVAVGVRGGGDPEVVAAVRRRVAGILLDLDKVGRRGGGDELDERSGISGRPIVVEGELGSVGVPHGQLGVDGGQELQRLDRVPPSPVRLEPEHVEIETPAAGAVAVRVLKQGRVGERSVGRNLRGVRSKVVRLPPVLGELDLDPLEDRMHLGEVSVRDRGLEPGVPVVLRGDRGASGKPHRHHLPVRGVVEIEAVVRSVVLLRGEVRGRRPVRDVPESGGDGDFARVSAAGVGRLAFQLEVEGNPSRPRLTGCSEVDVGVGEAEMGADRTPEVRGMSLVPGEAGILGAVGEGVDAAGVVAVGEVEHRPMAELVKDDGVVVPSRVAHRDGRCGRARPAHPSVDLPADPERLRRPRSVEEREVILGEDPLVEEVERFAPLVHRGDDDPEVEVGGRRVAGNGRAGDRIGDAAQVHDVDAKIGGSIGVRLDSDVHVSRLGVDDLDGEPSPGIGGGGREHGPEDGVDHLDVRESDRPQRLLAGESGRGERAVAVERRPGCRPVGPCRRRNGGEKHGKREPREKDRLHGSSSGLTIAGYSAAPERNVGRPRGAARVQPTASRTGRPSGRVPVRTNAAIPPVPGGRLTSKWRRTGWPGARSPSSNAVSSEECDRPPVASGTAAIETPGGASTRNSTPDREVTARRLRLRRGSVPAVTASTGATSQTMWPDGSAPSATDKPIPMRQAATTAARDARTIPPPDADPREDPLRDAPYKRSATAPVKSKFLQIRSPLRTDRHRLESFDPNVAWSPRISSVRSPSDSRASGWARR